MIIDQVESDLTMFARHHVSSGDIDPAYPVLRRVMDAHGMTTGERLWLVQCHLAFYQIGSALAAFERTSWAGMPPAARRTMRRFPLNTERRGLRGGLVLDYLDAARITVQENPERFWLGALSDDPYENFDRLWDRAMMIPWNGRWAAFKMIDLLMHTMDAPVAMPDMRLDQCSGPREGLSWLYGEPEADTRRLDQVSYDLRDRLSRRGVPLPWDQIETVLCDFNSMRKGHYYVGNDIDGQLADLNKLDGVLSQDMRWSADDARALAFPDAYLGERHGWSGPDPERRKAYRDTGLVVVR